MNFLIAGLGSIGRRHLRILKSLGDHKVYVLRSGIGKPYEEQDEKLKADRIVNSLPEISELEIDGALITNPTSLHIKTATEIADYGIPLFIEKPLGKNLDGIENLVEIVKEKNLPVQMGYNMMFHPCIIEIKKAVTEGKIGKVISAKAQFGTYMPAWHKNEDYKKSYAANSSMGGGVVLTSIHEQNYLTEFFGEVNEVKAMATSGNVTGIDAEEGVEILMRHSSGVVSNVHLNFFQKPYYRNCQIIGSEGTIYWDFRLPEVKIMNDSGTEIITKGKDYIELLDESYRNQMKYFTEVVSGKVKSALTLERGINDMKTALKILNEIGRN